MLALMLSLICVGLALSAWSYLGDAAPAGEAPPDDAPPDDGAQGDQGADAGASGGEDQAPPDPDFDRPANFRSTMEKFAEFIPEENRRAFLNRIEQGERWGTSAGKATEYEGHLKGVNEYAAKLATKFSDGPQLLKDNGPVKFMEMYHQYLQKKAGTAPQQPAASQRPAASSDPIQAVIKRLDAMEAATRARAEETQAAVAQKAFYAELNPAVASALKEWGVSNAQDLKEAQDALSDLATSEYGFLVEDSQDPGSVTATAGLKAVLQRLDRLAAIRDKAKRAPQDNVGTLKVPNPSERSGSKPKSYRAALDEFDTVPPLPSP